MDIHKPKGWHGFREFLKEFGTIVLGVLVALGAEQVAEALHGRHVIHEAEAAMRSELVVDDLPQAYVRMAIASCLVRDLNGLRSAVDSRIPPQQFGVLVKAYLPPPRTWDEDAWKATGASGAAARMDGARLLGWSTAYVQVPFLQVYADRETSALNRLSRSRYRSGAWTPQKADELSDTIDDLRAQNEDMVGDAADFLVLAKTHGEQLPPAVQQKLIADARQAYGDCVVKPNLDLVPASNQQVFSPEQWQEMKKSLGTPVP